MANFFESRFLEQAEAIGPGLINRLQEIESFPENQARDFLALFLETACKATNVRPILLGRSRILELPQGWLECNLESVAREVIDFCNDDEVRRLFEATGRWAPESSRRLALSLAGSENEHVREAVEDYLSE